MIEICRHESFAPVAADWTRLLGASSTVNVFSTLFWKETWWKLFNGSSRLSVLSLHDAGDCIGIVPFAYESGQLSLIGGEDLSDYLDFVVKSGAEERAYEAITRYLAAEDWRTVDLHCLAASSPSLRYLPAWAARQGYSVEVSEEEVCPEVDLPGDWEAYLLRLDKKDRHELRRKMRRLAGVGGVEFVRVDRLEDPEKDLKDFFRLHRLSREEKAEFMTPQIERFFMEIVARFLPEERLRLYYLTIDGARVASVICLDEGDQLCLYNSGYDPEYASLSVGLLLKAYCLREAIAEGKKKFNFLRGKEPYKYDLGGKDVPIYRCLVQRS